MTGHDDLFSELAFVTYRWRSKSRVQHLAHSCARISFASGSAMWLRGVTTKNVAARENQRLYGLFLAKFRSYFFFMRQNYINHLILFLMKPHLSCIYFCRRFLPTEPDKPLRYSQSYYRREVFLLEKVSTRLSLPRRSRAMHPHSKETFRVRGKKSRSLANVTVIPHTLPNHFSGTSSATRSTTRGEIIGHWTIQVYTANVFLIYATFMGKPKVLLVICDSHKRSLKSLIMYSHLVRMGCASHRKENLGQDSDGLVLTLLPP